MVILILFQIGGLGVMTLSVLLFKLIGRKVFIHQQMAVQKMFLHSPYKDIFRIVKNIIIITFCIEAIGTVLLTLYWHRTLPFGQAFYTGFFHSVSAFCNAGFSLFPNSFTRHADSFLLNITIGGLIIIGGIGFSVLYELQGWIKLRKKKRFRFSLQTRTVLLTTAILIAGGAIGFWILESHDLMPDHSLHYQIMISVFQSVTCRTAGFNTVDMASLNDATIALIIFLMFIGASPGSCGGGVKTTTLALLAAITWSRIRRMRRINIFKKSIPEETVAQGTTLVLISIGAICLILFAILAETALTGHRIHTGNGSFLPYLFEVVSAFGTVGLTMGMTPDLSAWGKFWIISTMIVGRVGILTFSYIIIGTTPTNGFEKAEENMMIG
jgi:trk system potassium uptake protein TrkH